MPARAQSVLLNPPPARQTIVTIFGVTPPPILAGPGLGLSVERLFAPGITAGLRAVRGSIPQRYYASRWFKVGPFGRYYFNGRLPRHLFIELSARMGREWLLSASYPTRTADYFVSFDGALGYRFAFGGWAAPVIDIGFGAGATCERRDGRWWGLHGRAIEIIPRPLLHIGIAL